MNLKEYASFDGIGLSELVKKKEVSPKELAALAAEAIDAINPEINAVVETYPDRIEDLDERNIPAGRFQGVPFLIKDVLGQEAGRKIEMGSRLCEGMICEQDTHYAEMLRAAGFNIIGRSNTPEYSIAGTTESALYGNTSTPWRKGYSAGGSSGGSAAAVSAGIVPIADGSDIAGSIRIPATWCGGVGLKPSRGRISLGPGRDEGGFGLAMVFGQHRTIRDVAAYLDCLAIAHPGDPFVIPKPLDPYASFVGKPAEQLKIGYSADPLMDAPVDPEVADAVEQVALYFEQQGHQVSHESPKFNQEEASLRLLDVWLFGFNSKLDEIGQNLGREVGPRTLEPVTLQIYEYSKSVTAEKFLGALDYINSARRRAGAYFSKYDIWLSPSAAQVSEPHGLYHLGLENVSAQEFIVLSDRPVQFSFPHNLMGTPAISLPLAMHSNGLPIGVQLGARPACEHILIQLASDLEGAMPWKERIPPLHVSNF